MTDRMEIIVLLASVVVAILAGDYLYSVTHSSVINIFVIFFGTILAYYGFKWVIGSIMRLIGNSSPK